ncbi:hypothetical protein AV530_008553 [Patagioenas fasciata monilis]|uniref:Uncharacterized protein n=1 Tax=Patagioenas fasciata monilis TaxID=372326 RepID=A0A1V4KEA2_PATFA|nr:hypothetical protein AV530_008553 [Patagioenas fasciata monilis]
MPLPLPTTLKENYKTLKVKSCSFFIGSAELDTKHGNLSRKRTGTDVWLLGRKMHPMIAEFSSKPSQHYSVSGFVQLFFSVSLLSVQHLTTVLARCK